MNANGADRHDTNTQDIRARGHAALRVGDIGAARACFAALRARHPDDPDALHGLACVALAAGRADLAIGLAGQALRLAPHGPFHEVLARALLAQGHHAAAQAAIRAACMCQPDDVPVLLACAEIMEATGDTLAAGRAYGRAVGLSPASAVMARTLHARFLWRRGQRDAAIQQMRHVVRLAPQQAVHTHELADMLLAHHQPGQAEDVLRAGVARAPDDGAALSLLGALVFARGQMAPAADLLERAMAYDPLAEISNNLGLARMALGDMAGADDAFAVAMRLRPDDARMELNRATGLFEGGNVTQAATVYETMLAQDPPVDGDTQSRARFNLGVARLAQGKLRQGWMLWESRLDFLPRHPSAARLPRWDGGMLPLGRKLLVHIAGQGLGDAVHFLRYVRLAARRVPIVLDTSPALRRLAATLGRNMPYPIEIITRDINYNSDIAAQCDLFSLPHLLDADSVPAFTPYLGECQWRQATGRRGTLRVGLCHAGNAGYRFDARRSIAVQDLSALGEMMGIEFISLRPQVAGAVDPSFVRHELPSGADLLDTARLIATLDLVISVDTLAAHLAGAMGCPVWLLCRFGGDWRWSAAFDLPTATNGVTGTAPPDNGATGEVSLLPQPASQWYPTLRLFRQARLLPPQQAWTQVVATVVSALHAWAVGQETG